MGSIEETRRAEDQSLMGGSRKHLFRLDNAMGENRTSRGDAVALAGLLVAGALFRLALTPLPGYGVDVTLFTDWTNTLSELPLDQFYGLVTPYSDYLPGYLYVLAATGWLKGLVSGPAPFTVQELEPWIKAGPILGDIVLGLALFRISRRFVGPKRALLAASFVVLNPGIVFVSAVWGQVESIATALYMLSLLALISGAPIVAALWAALGLITKPQYAIFLIPVGIAYLRSEVRRLPSPRSRDSREAYISWALRRVLAPIVVLAGTAQLLLLPFSMSFWPMPATEWTFLNRITTAQIDSFTSSGAFSLWATQLAGLRRLDYLPVWLSTSYYTWGVILFAGVSFASAVLAWRRPDSWLAVAWAAFLIAFGFFEVLTRMHERYLFPAIPLVSAAAVISLRAVPIFAAASSLYLINVWYIWANQSDVHANRILTTLASDLGALTFAVVVVAALRLAAGGGEDGGFAGKLWRADPVSEPQGRAAGRVAGTWTRILASRGGNSAALIAIALPVGILLGVAIWDQASRLTSPAQVSYVRAYRSWQDSGVSLAAGQKVTILAGGRWAHRMDVSPYGPDGSSGKDPEALSPSAPVGSLLGRVGRSAPFLVGETVTIRSSSEGPLQFAMNDRPDGRDDNRGRLKVTVAIQDE